jgi:hypothetical protein
VTGTYRRDPKLLRVVLPDGRGLVAELPDDGPHHVGVSLDAAGREVRVYVDGRDGCWRWARKGETPERGP